MDRRTFLALTAPAMILATPAAFAAFGDGRINDFITWRERFLALPGSKSFDIAVGAGRSVIWRASHRPDVPLFVASAIKTFILGKYLQEVEAGKLSEDELLPVDNDIRSFVSPVFGSNLTNVDNLKGATSARIVLEAMISHSDNTATDAALLRVGAQKVRAFIASAGLTSTGIPDSTRMLLCYLAGAPLGVDEGWAGVKKVLQGGLFGPPRSLINNRQTMISTASELVSYYRRALSGDFFSQPQTLTELKRILAMADAITWVVPADIAAYAKGGSFDWQSDHALCASGQMVPGHTPVTFCFTINWSGPDGVSTVFPKYTASVAGMLAAIAKFVV